MARQDSTVDRRASARGDSSDRRQARRPKAYLRGLVVSEDGKLKVECRVEDFAATGARLTVNKGTVLPQSMYLITACKESGFKAAVIWATPGQYGVRFERTFPLVNVKTPEAALLLPLKLGRLRSWGNALARQDCTGWAQPRTRRATSTVIVCSAAAAIFGSAVPTRGTDLNVAHHWSATSLSQGEPSAHSSRACCSALASG